MSNKITKVNEYMITFPFKGDYMYVTVDANYLANRFISIDSDYDFPYDEELFPIPTFRIFEEEFNKYIDYEIEIEDDGKLNVAYPSKWGEREDLEGSYAEKDIPYLLLKVTNKDVKNDIYNVTED